MASFWQALRFLESFLLSGERCQILLCKELELSLSKISFMYERQKSSLSTGLVRVNP
ncbi:hypothetical protein [Helicobacter rodentium]|uniref:hypothetical protein n=1 Tax=Helicobacter rodentium TaxID=59617 RepID=UPI00255801CE|nr:hypothetical protein [Helicobacter rodentium]